MTTIEAAILHLNEKLQGVPFDFAFLGGSVLTLLITDKTADAIRVTKDVDVMMSIRTRKEYHLADSELEQRGFKHDTREDAPVCRWICDDVTVDVLPIREDVLGWNSRSPRKFLQMSNCANIFQQSSVNILNRLNLRMQLMDLSRLKSILKIANNVY